MFWLRCWRPAGRRNVFEKRAVRYPNLIFFSIFDLKLCDRCLVATRDNVYHVARACVSCSPICAGGIKLPMNDEGRKSCV